MLNNEMVNEDFNRLTFILAEYLGMQSSKMDKDSLQSLHEFVHKTLNEFWDMTRKTSVTDGISKEKV